MSIGFRPTFATTTQTFARNSTWVDPSSARHAKSVTRKGGPIHPQQIQSMNSKLIPILESIIARDSVLSPFHADRLPQSALAYIRQNYRMDSFLSDDEQDLIETLAPFADHIAESFREDESSDASKYHLFDDGSLWLSTNAYQSIWADARDFAVEILLPRMELSRMNADLLRAIDMDDHIDEVRDDFFSSFAHILHRDCGIPHCDAREHWNAWSNQLSDSACESIVLGGSESGRAEGLRFASEYSVTNA